MALGKLLIGLGTIFILSAPLNIFYTSGPDAHWTLFRVLESLDSGILALHRMIAPPGMYMLETVTQAYFLKALSLSCELHLADHLDRLGPTSMKSLASELKVDPEKLVRLMEFLANQGVFVHISEDVYTNNLHSNLTRSDSLLTPVLLLMASDAFPGLHSAQLEVDSSDKRMYEADFLSLNKKLGSTKMKENYKQVIDLLTMQCANATSTQYPWNRHTRERVLSVRSGNGRLLSAALTSQPLLTGTLFDTPESIRAARKVWDASGGPASRRVTFIYANNLDPVPTGYDLYLLDHVLLRHTDSAVLEMMTSIAKAMKETKIMDPESHPMLIISDLVSDSALGTQLLHAIDVHLMALVHGKIRSKSGLEELVRKSGLKIRDRVQLTSLSSLFTAELIVT